MKIHLISSILRGQNRLILTLIFLFISLGLLAQKDEKRNNCALQIPIENMNLAQFQQGELLFTNNLIYHLYSGSDAQIYMTRINPNLGKSTRTVFGMTKKMQKLVKKRYTPSFAIDQQALYIKLGKHVFRYKIGLSDCVFDQKIELKTDYCSAFKANGNTFTFYDIYNQKDKDDAFLCRYNWKTQEEILYQSFELNFSQYTYIQPAEYISFLDDITLFAQGVNYRVDFYDTSGKFLHKLQLDDTAHFPLLEESVYAPYAKSERIFSSPKDYFSGLQKLPLKGSRIWSAQFINSSTVMVRFSSPTRDNKYSFVDDIWQFEDGIWGLKQSVAHANQKDLQFSCESMWPLFLFNSKFVIGNEKIYYLVLNTSSKLLDIDLTDLTQLDQMNVNQLKLYTIDAHE